MKTYTQLSNKLIEKIAPFRFILHNLLGMKKVLLSLTAIVLSLSSLPTFAAFTPSVTLPISQQQQLVGGISTVLATFAKKHTTQYTKKKFTLLHDKIEELFDTSPKITATGRFALEYIDRSVLQRLDKHATTPDTGDTGENDEDKDEGTSPPVTTPDTIDITDYTPGEKTILAERLSLPVVEFEVVAELEAIDIEEVYIETTNTGFQSNIEKVYLYDETGKLIDSAYVAQNKAKFRHIGRAQEGENYYYLAFKPHSTVAADTSFTFSFHITKAEGVTSHATISPTKKTNTNDIIHVSTIATNSMQLLDTYMKYHVDETMYNLARADIAIIAFQPTTPQHQDIVLDSLSVLVQDATTSQNAKSTLTLRRIDSISDAIRPSSIDGDEVHFDLTDLDDKKYVDSGQEVVFILSATPSLDANTAESITVELDQHIQDTLISYRLEDEHAIMSPQGLGYIGSITITD